MEFPFPAIAGDCPLCGLACGAIYRGYYRRWAICPQALFFGFLAIRTGLCRHYGRRFALFPEFLVSFRGFSRVAFLWLWRAWRKNPRNLLNSVDRWFDELAREVYISEQTLYSQLRLIWRQLHAGSLVFKTQSLPSGGVGALTALSVEAVEQAILHPAFGLLVILIFDPPQ